MSNNMESGLEYYEFNSKKYKYIFGLNHYNLVLLHEYLII